MIYRSEKGKVVGEFDAEDLHRRIDEVTAGCVVPLEYSALERALNGGEFVHDMDEVAGTRYRKLFFPNAFESVTSDGQTNSIHYVKGSFENWITDEWHADDSSGHVLRLPEILTTASRWPTEWLVGAVVARKSVFFNPHGSYFWNTEAGREAIERALQQGNAHTHKFEPGQVVKAPAGALHHRSIPSDESGYRYFKRHFPKVNLLHARPYLSMFRPR